jgi:hypothetical protein
MIKPSIGRCEQLIRVVIIELCHLYGLTSRRSQQPDALQFCD